MGDVLAALVPGGVSESGVCPCQHAAVSDVRAGGDSGQARASVDAGAAGGGRSMTPDDRFRSAFVVALWALVCALALVGAACHAACGWSL